MAGGTAHSWNIWPSALTNSRGNGGRRDGGTWLAFEGIAAWKCRRRSARIFVVRHRLYQVVVVSKTDKALRPEVFGFLESFRLTE